MLHSSLSAHITLGDVLENLKQVFAPNIIITNYKEFFETHASLLDDILDQNKNEHLLDAEFYTEAYTKTLSVEIKKTREKWYSLQPDSENAVDMSLPYQEHMLVQYLSEREVESFTLYYMFRELNEQECNIVIDHLGASLQTILGDFDDLKKVLKELSQESNQGLVSLWWYISQ